MLRRRPDRNPALAASWRSRGYWSDDSLVDVFERTAARLPARNALVDPECRLSFAGLHARVNSLAAGLVRRGVGPGSVVAVQLPNWWETVVVFWAVIRLGGLLCPILPAYRRRELGFILRESGAECLFVPGRYRGFDHRSLVRELRNDAPTLREIIVVRDEPEDDASSFAAVSRDTAAPLPDSPAASEVVLLMYTSGTTADPKGVLHSHQTLLYEARSLERIHELDERDSVLMPSPLTHVSGFIHAVLLPGVLGTRAVLMERWEPELALDLVAAESVTYMVGAPVFLSDLTFRTEANRSPTRTLRLFSCGGAGVSPDLILESRRRLGCVSKRVYGSTEFPTVTTTSADDPPERGATTEGRPIWAAEVRITDDDGAEVSRGVEGEILARGPDCFLGYRNPALDAEAFTDDGWFRTGDLGVLDADGFLTVTGRKKDIVIRKGEKLSAPELEAAIARHPAVADVAVVAVPDPETGERACACVVLRGGMGLELGDLARFLSDAGLATHKLPERLEIVPELPRTASGKVQKHRLRERIVQR